jgi:hypothetical protein
MRDQLLIAVLMSSAFIAGCGEAMSASARANATKANSAAAPQIEIRYTTYHCESGRTVRASYPEGEHAILEYAGRESSMFAKPSDGGLTYVGDGLEWHVAGTGAGSRGLLTRDSNGYVLETCVQPEIVAKDDAAGSR